MKPCILPDGGNYDTKGRVRKLTYEHTDASGNVTKCSEKVIFAKLKKIYNKTHQPN